MGWTTRVGLPAEAGILFSSPPHSDLAWSPSYLLSKGYWGLSLGVLGLWHEADHSPLSRAKVKLYLY